MIRSAVLRNTLLVLYQLWLLPLCVANPVAQLWAPDGVSADQFGYAVAIDGETALVGANQHDEPSRDGGAAYVFERLQGSWVFIAKLTLPEAGLDDRLGHAVALAGDNALVSASQGSEPGSVHHFRRSGGNWLYQGQLQGEDTRPNDGFGVALALDGSLAAVGASKVRHQGQNSGAVYLFRLEDEQFQPVARLTQSQGQDQDLFGIAVALSGDRVLIGASGEDSQGTDSGAAYLFDSEDGQQWQQRARLLAEDAARYDRFGNAVSLDHQHLLIAASQADLGPALDAGAAYLYHQRDEQWQLRHKLQAADPVGGEYFASAVAIHCGQALLGAIGNHLNGQQSGAAYLIDLDQPESAAIRLQAPQGQWDDRFGFSVALSQNQALVGAPGDDDLGSNAGSALLLALEPQGCPGE
ncbi:hypothetical protein [Ferrimonas marina]|uniref:FG-GAP repeat-containing protein n=1 Tax=Ferrimonas marina TaxID=299255 RepID=A0A1M5YEE8_9GAMM|nr:hypothetical protein [Ferrimonas marina]SHI10274.1 FG-GAP repeat-containing protein [Ferrimonas marina]